MRSQDKKPWFFFVLWPCLLCSWAMSCTVKNGSPEALSTETNDTASATIVVSMVTVTASSTMPPPPTITYTPSPAPIVLPAVTLSPQEAEAALQELLRTNGNCTGKCLAGIRPDEMTAQEAVDQMARWGMLWRSEGNDGGTGIHLLYLDQNSKQANVDLDMVWRNKVEPTYGISFNIPRFGDGEFLGADVWRANREVWKAFQFENLLKAYGTPSFVGFFMETRSRGSIAYTLDIQYEQMNLNIGIGGLANWNEQGVFICPSNDPHSLGIEVNPEDSLKVSLREIQQTFPITWQALTGSDLQTFYQIFTGGSNSDRCITTTIPKITELDPSFR